MKKVLKEGFIMKKHTLLYCLFAAVVLLGHGNLFSMDRKRKKKESPAEYYHRKNNEYANKEAQKLKIEIQKFIADKKNKEEADKNKYMKST